MNPQAKKLWKQIRNPNCTACPLHEEAQTVCLIGDGPVPADIMIVGEAPGFREDEISKPFAGRAGKLLDQTLEEVGLNRDDIYITNANKCRPPENRTPTKTEAKACRPYLEAEIEAVKPKFILTVGNHALSLIKKSGIMKHRGELYEYGDAKVIPTVHPAAVLRNPRYEMIWKTDLGTFARQVKGEQGAKPPKVYAVTDRKSLTACLKAILAAKQAVAYDLETTGFDDHDPEQEVVSISVSPKEGVAFVAPIHHPDTPWKSPDGVLRAIGKALMFTPAKRVAHNAKFDDRWLHRYGIPIHADFDTMLAAHVLDENRFKGLKPLAQMIVGADPWKDVDLSKGGAKDVPFPKLARYNAKDTEYTLRLYFKFREQLLDPANARTLRLFKVLMMPASQVLTQVERTGLWVNQKRLAERTVLAQKKVDKLLRKLNKLAGEEINWNSPQQVGRVMFGKLGLPLIETTKGGAPSTNESVLLRLRHKHPIARLLLEYREWHKNLSTYFLTWADKMDENGRMHPNYKLAGTVTGRLSSGKEEGDRGKGLNAQQVPRDPFIRAIIGAPPGWKFVEADFSQVELRVAAHYAQEPAMMRSFTVGEDIHLRTAMRTLGKPADQITKEERKKAKAVNFGFLYGMGAEKFVIYARDNYDVEVSEREAERVRQRFFDEYSALPAWHARQRRLANLYGKVQSLIGRVRHLPDIHSSDKKVRGEAERQAINSPVQSLASDMMLLGLVILHIGMNPKEAKIVGTVHDSILFEIREDVVDEWVKEIRWTMENLPLKAKFGVDLSVPIAVDIKVGDHWSEGEEV